jgi:acetylornithine deacetylase/succinyl-diaminopimelate desuccinylase-like protein
MKKAPRRRSSSFPPAAALVLLLSACAGESPSDRSPHGGTAGSAARPRGAEGVGKATPPPPGEREAARSGTATLDQVDWKACGDEALALLREYIRIDTSNAPGVATASGDVRKAADLLQGALQHEGIETRRLVHPQDPTRVVVLGRLRGDGSGGKPLLLEHHMDVVPAEGAWSHPPFAAEVDQGWLYGRGTADDKGLGALHLEAMLLLKRLRVPLARDVVFVANPDEEIGGERGASWLTTAHWDLLDPGVVLEEGGFGYEGRYRQGTTFEVQVDQKRVFWLELLASGEGGHGSVPRENALVILERAVDRILAMPREPRITPTLRATYAALVKEPAAALKVIDSIVGDPIERSRMVDSIALTRMQGSDKVNTQPREARASLDVRLLPDTDPKEFLSRLHRVIADDRVKVVELHPREEVGAASPIEGPVFRAIASVVSRRWPGAVAIPSISTGGTDSRNYRSRGVPAYGFIPFVVPDGDRLRIHDVDERVRVEDVREGVRTMFEIVRELAAKS